MIVNFKLRYLAKITLYLIICQVVLFRFFNIQRYANKILLVCEVICLSWGAKRYINFNKWIIVFIAILVANGLSFGFGTNFRSNVLMLLYPLMDILFLCWYLNKYEESSVRMIKKMCFSLNAYMWVNILVMLIQMKGTYFMVGLSDWENPAYWDLISGLFGYSTTHVVCMFSSFVILYDVVSLKTINGYKKKMMKFNIALLIVVLSSMSIVNDNIAFFIVAPISLIYWFLFSNNLKKVSRLEKMLLIFLMIIVIVAIIAVLFPSSKTYLYEEIFYKFVGVFQMANKGTDVTHGSMERIAQIVYGLNSLNGWKLGAGLDEVGLFHDEYFGFAHFGLANAGGMVCLCGIWSWLSLCLSYSELACKFIDYRRKKHLLLFFIILFVILLSVYTTLFTDISIALSAFFIAIPFWYAKRINIIN